MKSLMCPAADSAEFEVLRIGFRFQRCLLRLVDAEGNATARGIGDGLLQARELHADLRSGVARTCPAHQRLDRPRGLRLVFQDPFAHARPSLLHGSLGGLVDAGGHEQSRHQ